VAVGHDLEVEAVPERLETLELALEQRLLRGLVGDLLDLLHELVGVHLDEIAQRELIAELEAVAKHRLYGLPVIVLHVLVAQSDHDRDGILEAEDQPAQFVEHGVLRHILRALADNLDVVFAFRADVVGVDV